MHEFALVQDLMEQAVSRMRAEGASRVKSIELHVGRSSGYSKESLNQAFEILAPDSGMGEAKLVMKRVEGTEVVLRRIVLEK